MNAAEPSAAMLTERMLRDVLTVGGGLLTVVLVGLPASGSFEERAGDQRAGHALGLTLALITLILGLAVAVRLRPPRCRAALPGVALAGLITLTGATVAGVWLAGDVALGDLAADTAVLSLLAAGGGLLRYTWRAIAPEP